MKELKPNKSGSWRSRIHEVIYEADTPAGKTFDVILLILIVLSIVFVMMESVASIDAKYHDLLLIGEWILTIFFTIEYILRIVSIKKPSHYIFSFYGIIDFLATIPLYLSLFLGGTQALVTVRALRLLRIFRILKVTRYVGESNKLVRAIKHSWAKISIFLFAVLIVSIIAGTLMYFIEGEESGFRNIPISIYWCIVTLTTVGYGDIAPVTPLGQLLSAIIMIMGYGIIAVPTGIISAEYARNTKVVNTNTQSCRYCGKSDHRDGAKHCFNCGEDLHPNDN
ncbi:ion transporter [Gilvibacter sp.]|uniref:ion transporter n=1 Tax=Gilvibacter sp. TaxID=2729997 RepID=UPI003F49D093